MRPGHLCAVLAAWWAVLGSQLSDPAVGQEKLRESPYFPLQVGHEWTYRMREQRVTVRVVKSEVIDRVLCARLETKTGNKILTENVAMQDDGVCRFSADGSAITPPLCFFKPDAKTGSTWKNAAVMNSLPIEATFTAGEAKVTVPAGNFQTRTATTTDFRLGQERLAVTYWFAKGIGMVKQRLQIGDREVLLELEKFVPAK